MESRFLWRDQKFPTACQQRALPVCWASAEAGCRSKEVGWWRWDLGNWLMLQVWFESRNSMTFIMKLSTRHFFPQVAGTAPTGGTFSACAHLQFLLRISMDKAWILMALWSQGCFLGWTKPSKSSRKLHLGSVGWEERGGEHSCVFVSQRYMICCHGGFLLGFHLILSNAKCCVFSFASFEDNRTQWDAFRMLLWLTWTLNHKESNHGLLTSLMMLLWLESTSFC